MCEFFVVQGPDHGHRHLPEGGGQRRHLLHRLHRRVRGHGLRPLRPWRLLHARQGFYAVFSLVPIWLVGILCD